MYIPSIFKSVQEFTCVVGNNTLPIATDPAYTELSINWIASGNGSGFNVPIWQLEQNSPTNIYVGLLSPMIGLPEPATVIVTVREYLPFFFRRPFHHTYGIIPTQQYTAVVNTGIAFGPKAYLITRGFNWTFNRNESVLEISDAQTHCSLALNRAAGTVTLTRRALDYLNSPPDPESGNPGVIRQGDLYHWFSVIDPW
jgi:hypothetical protein